MTKIINLEVEICDHCPYLRYASEWGSYSCSYNDSFVGNIEDYCKIQTWCPLPNKGDK